MTIDNQLLDTLSAAAKVNPRQRQAYDLRNTPEDNSQRMLNALEPGTVMPIHRHRKSSETICMVRGKLIMRHYDDNGNVTDEFVMAPTSLHSLPSKPEGECDEPTNPMVQIEAGQWHSLEVLEEDTIVFEAKDGRYESLAEEDIIKM